MRASYWLYHTKNLEAREAGLLYIYMYIYIYICHSTHVVSPKSYFFIKCFHGTLGGSDCVYGEISIIPTKLIPNPVSKFVLEKNYEISNLAFLGCSAGPPHQSVHLQFSHVLNFKYMLLL